MRNSRCSEKQVYSRLVQKKLAVWGDIRNNADHAHFDQYDDKDVRTMLDGITGFLSQHLG